MIDSNAWGGHWTEIKVNVLKDYLQSYQIALRNTKFHRCYIDALAGDGTWQQQGSSLGSLWGLEEEEKLATESIREGSALVAISVDPAFDRYIFNDLNLERTSRLKARATERGLPPNSIQIETLDANNFIREFCLQINVRRERGVVLLDPWGMQVNWATVKHVASTLCLDMWYLFPTQPVVRMLPHSGLPRQSWCDKLDECLGTEEWRTEFYHSNVDEPDLFADAAPRTERDASFANVESFVVRRLRDEFKGAVLDKPLRLGPRNNPIFSFCFASANPSRAASGLANRLAKGVIKANNAT